jgi:hypothetical protein
MTRIMTFAVIVNPVILLVFFGRVERLILFPLGVFILLIVNLAFLFLLVREKKML